MLLLEVMETQMLLLALQILVVTVTAEEMRMPLLVQVLK